MSATEGDAFGAAGPDDYADVERAMVRAFIEALIASGEIDPTGKSESEIRADLRELMDANPSLVQDVVVALSHEEKLLQEARRYGAADLNLAIIMYATWFEHRLNYLLIWGLQGKGMGDKEASEVVKAANIYHKTGSTFFLIFGERIDESAVKAVRRVAEARNAFVHYKWTTMPLDELAPSGSSAGEEIIAAAEQAVEVLDEEYRNRVLRGYRWTGGAA